MQKNRTKPVKVFVPMGIWEDSMKVEHRGRPWKMSDREAMKGDSHGKPNWSSISVGYVGT